MSLASDIVPIGLSVFRKSLGLSLWRGVSTIPGATALKRMCCFAYSLARLIVIALRPPFVIMGMEDGAPAIGLSASEAVRLMTLPPLFCLRNCLTAG